MTHLGVGKPLADVGGAGPSLDHLWLCCAAVLQAANTNALSMGMHLSGAQLKS